MPRKEASANPGCPMVYHAFTIDIESFEKSSKDFGKFFNFFK